MSWGQAAETVGKGAESATGGGFQIEPFGVEAGNVATDGTGVSLTPNQISDVKDYGTSNPTLMDQTGGILDRFQKGGNQGIADTYKNFGNNAETYGAAYGLANKLSAAGKPQGGAAPITTNINYQQPVNPYLQKRGRY